LHLQAPCKALFGVRSQSATYESVFCFVSSAAHRRAFSKPLSGHQAIRMHVATMIRRIEPLQAWLESLCYNLTTMSHDEAFMQCGDLLALAKTEASKVYEVCAHSSTMIFGGELSFARLIIFKEFRVFFVFLETEASRVCAHSLTMIFGGEL
jgi:hypothetical protein